MLGKAYPSRSRASGYQTHNEMNEEEIEEWYSQQLEQAASEYLESQKTKKVNKTLEGSYKAKIKGIREEYSRKYEDYFQEKKKKKKIPEIIEKYRRLALKLKEAPKKILFKIKWPLRKINQMRNNPSWVLKKVKIFNAYEYKKFKLDISYNNLLEKLHIRYPLLVIRRYHRKTRLNISKIKGSIGYFFSRKFNTVKGWVANLIQIVIGFGKKLANKLSALAKNLAKKAYEKLMGQIIKLKERIKERKKKFEEKKVEEKKVEEKKVEEKKVEEKKEKNKAEVEKGKEESKKKEGKKEEPQKKSEKTSLNSDIKELKKEIGKIRNK